MIDFDWRQCETDTKEDGAVRLIHEQGRSEAHHGAALLLFDTRDGSGRLALQISAIDDAKLKVGKGIINQSYAFKDATPDSLMHPFATMKAWVGKACEQLDRGEKPGDTPDLDKPPTPEQKCILAAAKASGKLVAQLVRDVFCVEDGSKLTKDQMEFATTLEQHIRAGLMKVMDACGPGATLGAAADDFHGVLAAALAKAKKGHRFTSKQHKRLGVLLEASREVADEVKAELDAEQIQKGQTADGRSIH